MTYFIWSHRCRKCKGQFYLEETVDGACLTCIQCGHSEYVTDETKKIMLEAIQPVKKRELIEV